MGGARVTSSCHSESTATLHLAISFLYLKPLLCLPPHDCALTGLLCQWPTAGGGGDSAPATAAAGSVQLSNREIGETLQRETLQSAGAL